MSRLYTFMLMVTAFCSIGRAQTSDIIVFSEEGEKFTLIVDGQTINETPALRVMAREVRNSTPMLKVDFADASIPSIKQNGWMEPGLEYTLKITTNRKGVRVLRLQGQNPLGTHTAESAAPDPSNFRADAPTKPQTTEVVATDAAVRPTRTTTTTTTTVNQGGTDGAVNMSIQMNGTGVNISVNDGTNSTTQTVESTMTTRDTHGGNNGDWRTNHHQTVEKTRTRRTLDADEPVVIADGCGAPMEAGDFNAAKSSIDGQGFEETKLTLAKQIAGSNCLSTDQVKAVMDLFGFEDSKLDFAKFAYDRVSDRKNYFKVNDAFGFSSSVDELNKYIQSR